MPRLEISFGNFLSSRISNMKHFKSVSCVFLLFLWTIVHCDDALKNHRLEKRQDDFMLFGGWRPVRSGNTYHHPSSTGRFHDLISALPTSFDATSRFYTHALPSTYHKDIYNYYPRPAIKSAPKKNSPVYMERFKPQKHNYGGGGGIESFGSQYIDLPQIDLNQIQNLHKLIQNAKDIPFPQLNLPIESGNPVKIIELPIQALQQGGQPFGGKSSGSYSRNRISNKGKKSGYGRIPQSRIPYQTPFQYEYISFPKTAPIIPQIFPKDLSLTPVKVSHAIPSIEDVLGLKNIQIVEVPVPSDLYGAQNGKGGQSSQYKIESLPGPQQYAVSPQSSPTNYASLPYKIEQSRKPHVSHKSVSSHTSQPHTVEAELFKLSEGDLKDLLANLQILEKAPHDLLKHLPIGDLEKLKEELQLVSLPEEQHGSQIGGYQQKNSAPQKGGYESNNQYASAPVVYSQEQPNYKLSTGGYQIDNSQPSQENYGTSGYQRDQESKSGGDYHQQNGYQIIGGQTGYGQQYQEDGQQERSNSYQSDSQSYNKGGDDSKNSAGVYTQGQQSYIQVIAQPNKDGYRREPVLAVEIQHGQTVEEAIKSLDPDTLKKLGAHGKDGLEIEVVEVPIDEYTSESKTSETVVSSKNSTLVFKKRILDKKS